MFIHDQNVWNDFLQSQTQNRMDACFVGRLIILRQKDKTIICAVVAAKNGFLAPIESVLHAG
jgi:hypothetical protein